VRGDVYDFAERIARYRRIIAKLRNGEVALRLLDHLASLGLSEAAICSQASHIIAVLRLTDFDLASASRSDVERVIAKINGNRAWKEKTKYHKKFALRRLVQYAKYGSCERGTPLPPEVSWIKLTKKDRDTRVTPEALLTAEDFEALVKAADNKRDKAMLYVLFEGAFRPGELLNMTVGSVQHKKDHCVVSTVGKTGLKVIPLVVSYKPLLEWLEEHPRRTDPNAPLWCSLATNYKGERLSYRHFRLIIKRLAKKAGLRKSVWPYLFRHSMLTALAKVFTEARLEQFAGWVHGSKMAGRYVHFSARDLEDAVLELHGKKEPSSVLKIVNVTKCPRCGSENPQGTVRCKFCGYILDRETAARMEEEDKKEIEDLKRQIQELRSAVTALISERQASQQPSQARQSSEAAPQEPSSGQQQSQTQRPPESVGVQEFKSEG